jgi:molybdenum cofactor biosynthesis enzyme MoaA
VSRLEDLIDTALLARDRGFKNVVLIGGEPTIQKGFFSLIRGLRETGFEKVILTTNGLLLASKAYLKSVVESGVTTVHLSLDDFDEKTLTRLSRNGSTHALVMKALNNMLEMSEINVYLYAVVTKLNIPHLEHYVHEVARLDNQTGRLVIVFAGVKPVGRAYKNKDNVLPRASESAEAIRKALNEAVGLGVGAMHKNCQPCLLPDLLSFDLDAFLEEVRLDLQTGKTQGTEAAKGYVMVEPCKHCVLKDVCGGVHENYVKLYGFDEFKAIKKVG